MAAVAVVIGDDNNNNHTPVRSKSLLLRLRNENAIHRIFVSCILKSLLLPLLLLLLHFFFLFIFSIRFNFNHGRCSGCSVREWKSKSVCVCVVSWQAKSQLLEIMHKGNVDGFIWTDLACSVNSNAKTENHISQTNLSFSHTRLLSFFLTKPCKFNAFICVYIDISVLFFFFYFIFSSSFAFHAKTIFDIHRLFISQI